MTGTDKAFIRVYGEPKMAAEASEQQTPAPGQPSQEGMAVPYVSQFYTAATHTGQLPTSTAFGRRRTMKSDQGQRSKPMPQTPLAPGRYSLGTIGASSSDRTNRVDGPQPVGSPHLSGAVLRDTEMEHPSGVSSTRNGPRHAGLPMQPRALRPFRPQWEVDSFTLPDVCSRLQSESSIGLAELFRAVLMRAWRGRPVVAISAFGRGEGSTTVTLCLARLAATFATRVGVIDGNIVHPSVAEMLGLSARNGWVNMTAEQPLTHAAIGAGDDRMVILPLASPSDDDAVEQSRARAANTITALRECFDLILIDAGPIFQAAHLWFCHGMHKIIDAAIVVRDIRNTTPLQLEDVCLRIQQAGIQDVSIVENFQTPSLAIG